jgi:hypothetical protein
MEYMGPEWVQAGELGLAFIVIILCSGLVLFVMKSSSQREQELLQIITKVLPVMEGLVASTNTINMGIGAINLRLESIEDNQILLWTHKMPNKLPLKKAKTVPVKQAGIAMGELEAKIEAGKIDEEK